MSTYTDDMKTVTDEECRYIKVRRKKAGTTRWSKNECENLVGLALSGGGIRSATFNLGVLQALSERGILRWVDYLSTVSGGGYIGSSLTTLLACKKDNNEFIFSPNHSEFPFNPDLQIFSQDGANKPTTDRSTINKPNVQLRHLLNKGYFLLSQARVLHRETLRAVGTIIAGSIYTLIIFFTLIIVVSAIHYFFANLLAPGLTGKGIDIETLSDLFTLPYPTSVIGRVFLSSLLIGGILSSIIIIIILWLIGLGKHTLKVNLLNLAERFKISPKDRSEQERADVLIFRILGGMTISLLVVVICVLKRCFSDSHQIQPYWLWVPLLFMIGNWVGVGIVYVLFTSWLRSPDKWNMRCRSTIWTYQGLIVYGMVFALIFALLALPHYFKLLSETPENKAAVSLALALISGAWSVFLARGKEISGRGLLAKLLSLPTGFRNGLLTGLVSILILSLIFLFQTLFDALIDSYNPSGLLIGGIFIGALLIPVILILLVDLNRISPYYFYRDRLSEAFLRTEMTTPDHDVKTARDDTELRLTCLNPDKCTAPYHLIVAAVNMAGARNKAYRDRKSDHFIFSRYYCGSKATGYVKTNSYMEGKVEVAQAVAISGAAVGSSLGHKTSFAQAFITTILNLRLGYWMDNPKKYKDCRFKSSLPWWRTFNQLFFEAFAKTSDRHRWVNLSDGGHTGDNIGLYPLLQRRCKVIIASDAGADPDYTFDDLARLIRQAYIDENITIKINLEVLRRDPQTGYSKCHYAIGQIKYPENDRYNGWLIYLKPTMTIDEDDEIPLKSYWQKHKDKDRFPQQTTLDQFFSEAQFEAYRRLGELTVECIFPKFDFVQFLGQWEEQMSHLV